MHTPCYVINVPGGFWNLLFVSDVQESSCKEHAESRKKLYRFSRTPATSHLAFKDQPPKCVRLVVLNAVLWHGLGDGSVRALLACSPKPCIVLPSLEEL